MVLFCFVLFLSKYFTAVALNSQIVVQGLKQNVSLQPSPTLLPLAIGNDGQFLLVSSVYFHISK